VDGDVMRARAAAARVARIATITAGGDPHVVPCCFAVDGDRLFTAVDDVKAKSTMVLRRLGNIAAHPRASVLVDHYAEDWDALWWVRMDGPAHVAEVGALDHATAVELLGAKYPQYRLRPPPGPAIVVAIDTWRAWP
jgi:PPOX class probable F420-dependent enzyme